jgi:hypothetical protein
MAFYATRIAAQDYSYADAFDSGDNSRLSGILASRAKQFEPLQLSESIMFSCQVVLLFLIVVSFAITGFLCNRRILNMLSPFQESSSVASQRRGSSEHVSHQRMSEEQRLHILDKVLGTATVVFFAFILRAILSALFAAGYAQNAASPNQECGECQKCQTLNFLISRWIYNTYEFSNIVSCVSPLAITVALWGMSNQRMRRKMFGSSVAVSLSDGSISASNLSST